MGEEVLPDFEVLHDTEGNIVKSSVKINSVSFGNLDITTTDSWLTFNKYNDDFKMQKTNGKEQHIGRTIVEWVFEILEGESTKKLTLPVEHIYRTYRTKVNDPISPNFLILELYHTAYEHLYREFPRMMKLSEKNHNDVPKHFVFKLDPAIMYIWHNNKHFYKGPCENAMTVMDDAFPWLIAECIKQHPNFVPIGREKYDTIEVIDSNTVFRKLNKYTDLK